jgi:hypothetical protein
LVFIVNNHLARCALLNVKFISQSVTELSADLNASMPTYGYRNVRHDILLCAGDAKLFKVAAAYPHGCKKDMDDAGNPYLVPVIVLSSFVAALGAVVVFYDIKTRRNGYRPMKDTRNLGSKFSALNFT